MDSGGHQQGTHTQAGHAGQLINHPSVQRAGHADRQVGTEPVHGHDFVLASKVAGDEGHKLGRDAISGQVNAGHARLAGKKVEELMLLDMAQRDQGSDDLGAGALLLSKRFLKLAACNQASLDQKFANT